MKAKIAKYHHNCKNNFSGYKLKKKIEEVWRNRNSSTESYHQPKVIIDLSFPKPLFLIFVIIDWSPTCR